MEDIVLFEVPKARQLQFGFTNIYSVKIIKSMRKLKNAAAPIIFGGTEGAGNKNVDMILINESLKARDSMQFRNSMLNISLLTQLKKAKQGALFSFNEILYAEDKPKVIGRMMQDIKLCRKYKIRMLFVSLATKLEEMRGSYELVSFAKILGMLPDEAKRAFNITQFLQERKKCLS